jgi:hypothetical protein
MRQKMMPNKNRQREKPQRNIDDTAGTASSDVQFNPVHVAAKVLLAKAVELTPGLREALNREVIAVAIEVPDRDWVDPIGDAWLELVLPPQTSGGDGESSDFLAFDKVGQWLEYRSDGLQKNGRWSDRCSLGDAMASGRCVVGISEELDRQCPRDLLRIADFRVVIPQVDEEILVTVVEQCFGGAPKNPLDPTLCRLISTSDLSLARRQGQTAEDYVSRLRALVTDKVPTNTITLDSMRGMDEAARWGRTLPSARHRRYSGAPRHPRSRVGFVS